MSVVWKDGDTPIVGEYLELRSDAGLDRRSAAAAAKGLSGGLYSVMARDAGRLVAMGRVTGDGGLTATLVDVLVHPDWNDQGLGAEVMTRLLGWCKDTLPRGCDVSLVAEPGTFSLYTGAGFEIRTGMSLRLE